MTFSCVFMSSGSSLCAITTQRLSCSLPSSHSFIIMPTPRMPCCLVNEHGQPVLAPVASAHSKKHQHHQRGPHQHWVGLALLLASAWIETECANAASLPNSQVSTNISTIDSPSVFHQLASFLALEENAEEEGVDTFTPHEKSRYPALQWCGAKCRPPEMERGKVRLIDSIVRTGSYYHVRTVSSVPTVPPSTEPRRSSSSTSSLTNSPALSSSATSAGASSDIPRPITPLAVSSNHEAIVSVAQNGVRWQHINPTDAAVELGDDDFTRTTIEMVQTQQLFPTIYRCFLDELPASTLGKHSPSEHRGTWQCTQCGHSHGRLREACIRCHYPNGGVTKLFVGQLRKEAQIDELIIQLAACATTAVAPLHGEGHYQSTGGQFRGRGCGSLYVSSATEADTLSRLMDKTMFIDYERSTGREVLYFVYREQARWLQEFARVSVVTDGPIRPKTLPTAPVVCELSATTQRESFSRFGPQRATARMWSHANSATFSN